MTRVSIRFVALFLSGAMWLEASPTFSEESDVRPPLTIGAPHYCGQHYPQHALDNEIEGRVGLKVLITNEGNVANPVVTEPSGNTELDEAAVACVLGWKFQPAQRDDKSVTVSGTLHVNWRLPYIPFVERRQCFNHYGVTPRQRPNTGETIVTFRIESGQVLDASVLTTSGNAELDQNAIACVESWRYAATNDDGTPTRRHMKETILWVPGPSEESGNERVCHSKVGVGFLGDHTHRTRIAFTIEGDGTVKNPYIWVSSGNMYLDGESLECVSKWRYVPIIVDGKPTEFPWDIGIDWQPLCFALCPSIYR